MELEVVLTAHTKWWLRFLNWLGADMEWTHALLRYDSPQLRGGFIIEASSWGVVRRRWHPAEFERYARFTLKDEVFEDEDARQSANKTMLAFAMGEVGKRYDWESLFLILVQILRRIWRNRPVAKAFGLFIGEGEVCTSLVDRTYKYGGFDLVPSEAKPWVLPDDFAASELLARIP